MTTSALIFLHVPKTAGMTLRNVIQKQYGESNCYVIGEDINAEIINFRNKPLEAAHKIDALVGHMSFGLHQYMRKPATYVTMLRDPVKRAISEYQFLKGNTYHPIHHAMKTCRKFEKDYFVFEITQFVYENSHLVFLTSSSNRSQAN